MHHIRRTLALLVTTMLCSVVILGLGFRMLPALAVIQQLEEAPGQILYQSRHTLQDQHGHQWQAIAFNRLRSNKSTSFYVRLVGFPGIAEIDRSQPLTLTTSLDETLTASDVSSNMFTDASKPEPNIGQYDLEPVITTLQPVIPVLLSVPTLDSTPILLSVSPSIVQEWQALATYDD